MPVSVIADLTLQMEIQAPEHHSRVPVLLFLVENDQ
jgi:hypothetical protein